MANFTAKITYFFQGPDLTGWSENYWVNVPTYQAAINKANTLLGLRLNILQPPYAVSMIRVSNDLKGTRDSELVPAAYPLIGLWSAANTCANVVPPSQMGLVMRTETSPFSRSSRFLHGVDGFMFNGQRYTPIAPFVTALNLFIAELINGTWFIPVKNKNVGQQYAAIVLMQPRFWHSRRTGRPFGQLVGRRRVR